MDGDRLGPVAILSEPLVAQAAALGAAPVRQAVIASASSSKTRT
jgi:hypothetical protein